MTIYLVVDDEHRSMFESENYDNAVQEAELLNLMYDERHFTIEETEINVH